MNYKPEIPDSPPVPIPSRASSPPPPSSLPHIDYHERSSRNFHDDYERPFYHDQTTSYNRPLNSDYHHNSNYRRYSGRNDFRYSRYNHIGANQLKNLIEKLTEIMNILNGPPNNRQWLYEPHSPKVKFNNPINQRITYDPDLPPSNLSNSKKPKPFKCQNCNLYHFKNECEAENLLCFQCGRLGHFKRCCPETKNKKLIDCTDSAPFVVNTCDISPESTQPKVTVECDKFAAKILNQLESSIKAEKSMPSQNESKIPLDSKISPDKTSSALTSPSDDAHSIPHPNDLDSYTKLKQYYKQQQEKSKKSQAPTKPKIYSPVLPPEQIIASTVSYDPYEVALKNGYLPK